MNNSKCETWQDINPNETIELLYIVTRGLIGTAAMIGNSLILLSVIRFNYLKKASAYYLCNMAAADFLLGLVGATYPMRVSYFSKTSQITRNLSFVVHNFAVFHSMCSMVIVAADRFSYICHPLTYEAKIFATKPYLFIIMSIAWTTTVITFYTYTFIYHRGLMIEFGTYFDLAYFLVVVCALFVLYGAIMKVASKQRARDAEQQQQQNQRQQQPPEATPVSTRDEPSSNHKVREAKANRKVIYGYMFIVATFICTFVYANIMMHIRYHLDYCDIGYDRTSTFYFFLLTSVTLQNFNAVCNPIVYSYCLTHFRQAFRKNIVQIATCGHKSGEPESTTRNSFVLDVPDDRKGSSLSHFRKSVTQTTLTNTASNGSNTRANKSAALTKKNTSIV